WSLGVRTDPRAHLLGVRDEIAGAISLGHVEGAVQKADRDRLLGALDLGERSIDEIMRHRSDIEMIDVNLPVQKVLQSVLKSSHTRLPLYRGDPENIVGVLHVKDLLRAVFARQQSFTGQGDPLEGFNVMDVAMQPHYAPETASLDDQMHQFLRRHTHFALVVDEYGALQGLITLEDILEEIVGEITDEFDSIQDITLQKSDSGEVIVDGAMTIRDLNRAADWNLPDDEANTVAGLVIHEAQMIPAQGQAFSFHGYRFEVVKRKANRITRLKIRRL
ncbi:MAG: HlyC/CorC family transporter, partial [Paracoccaceae bacterium]